MTKKNQTKNINILLTAVLFGSVILAVSAFGVLYYRQHTFNSEHRELNDTKLQLEKIQQENDRYQQQIRDLKRQLSFKPNNLLKLTNEERAKNGEPPLALNNLLDRSAQAKADDMYKRNYWSHNTPDGNPTWVFIQSAGYAYSSAGENLARNYFDGSATITAWMNSKEHRDNLLNPNFTEVGFGLADFGFHDIVVAHYASPS